ncbi:integrase domain-containing protein [Umboniibacter marinipuniceus]|uniref:Integrase-like protein n=1 Tax=Umboniibacter marinipuniceus TaxID=569599 RepID=A0A3M0ADZ0_9GAMM|nr:integrase domain-containing protein [Umboniibacter marinipuniceus]RMA82717.1 integrase-like protein [Umboniibacter marinipuniceus]
MIEEFLGSRRRLPVAAATLRADETRLQLFVDFLSAEELSLEEIEREDIERFSRSLSWYSTAYAHNVLSSTNGFLAFKGREDLVISPADSSERKRVRVRVRPLRFNLANIRKAAFEAGELSPRLGSVVMICALLGLRLREAILLEIRESLRSYRTIGRVDVIHGTKGGRSREVERLVTPLEDIEEVLVEALPLATNQRGNLLGEDANSDYFYRLCERKLQPILKSNGIACIHDLRTYFAVTKFERAAGHLAPINTDTVPKNYNKEHDRAIRLALSEEMGHSRWQITNSYLGTLRGKKR